jgi:hypothetical protein
MLHPGFNKTGMTKKYEEIWEIEGAVDSRWVTTNTIYIYIYIYTTYYRMKL